MAQQPPLWTLPGYEEAQRSFYSWWGPDSDFNKFLTDEGYRNSLLGSGPTQSPFGFGGEAFKGMPIAPELQRLIEQAKGITEAGQPINLDPQFAQLRGEVGELSKQSLESQRANIGRAAEGAQERATEGLAGTGLGRSGVAAEQFGSIETRRQDLLAGAEAQVEQKRLETLFNLSLQQANMEYSEQLRVAGFSQDMIKDALGFDRMLMQMQFAQELQGDEGNWFTDLIDIGAGLVGISSGLGWQPLA